MGVLKRYATRVEERAATLDAALADFIAICRTKSDVRAVYIFGSFASRTIGPTSDLDILVVRETDAAYWNRGDDLRKEAALRVPADLIVVTPSEYRERLAANGFGRTILASARCVYAA
jgi:predicted nucleotidyltransferase